MNVSKRFSETALLAGIAAMLLCYAAPWTVARAQAPSVAGARLEIIGADNASLSISASEFKTLPRTTVRVSGQNGQAAQVYEGVALSELLQRVGVPQGGDLGGSWMAAWVMAMATDGYRVAFSLAELESGLGSTSVLVADTLDGVPLGEGQGPFRLIVPSDKRAARWVRTLRSIRVERPSN